MPVKIETPNKLAAPNPAMTSPFHAGHHWRGIREPCRWARHRFKLI